MPRRHEHKCALSEHDPLWIVRAFPVIVVCLLLDVSLHAQFPARDAIRNEGVARVGLDETVPAAELDTRPCAKADPGRARDRGQDEVTNECRQLRLGVAAVGPSHKIVSVNEGQGFHCYQEPPSGRTLLL